MPFAFDHRNEITLDLFTLTALQNIGWPRDTHLQAIRGASQFALEQSQREIIQSAATILLGHIGGIKTELNRLLLNFFRKLFRHIIKLFDHILMRIEFILDKAAHGIDEHLLFFGNRKSAHNVPFFVACGLSKNRYPLFRRMR